MPPRTRFEIVKERDTRRMFKDGGHFFTLNDERYDCQFSATDDDTQLADDGGGILEVYDLTATVIKSDFRSGLPAKGVKVKADGATYQVERTQAIPFSVLAKIYFSNLDV